jgi:hypothetical protein
MGAVCSSQSQYILQSPLGVITQKANIDTLGNILKLCMVRKTSSRNMQLLLRSLLILNAERKTTRSS